MAFQYSSAEEALRFLTWKRLLTVTVLAVLGPTLLKLVRRIIRSRFSPLRVIPGPENGHIVFGHMKQIRTRKQGLWHEEMIQRYGHVIKYKAYFGVDRVYTTDTKAVNYVLNHSMVYRKPDQTRFMLSRILGDGLLFVEGHDHKRQRRVMNPSFGTSHIRDMTSIFVDKSAELRDVLMSRLTSKEGEGEVKLDILSYLSRATLDIIGLAGFDYSFNTLANEEDGLAKSFKKLFQPGGGFPIAQLLKAQFPILRSLLRFDQQSKCADDVHRRMTEIGKRLIETKKEEVKQQKSEGSLLQGTKAKDLLSLLIFSNLDDMADASKALTDDEVLHQIPTFLLAGHETTSTATAWTLLSLADNPEVQKRLRDEVLDINTESPTMEELNSLPYLEAVVRESLRYHAVVSGVIRVATEGDVIPLDKPFVDTTGKVQNSIMISQGDTIYLPIRYLNTAPSIWGDDGKSFNPERWNAVPKETSAIPGVWGSQLTFLGGPRACIGYRFALVEMKALLFFLVGNFEFKLAVPVEDIGRHPGIVTRPAVLSELEKGIQLPLVVRPFVRDA